MLACGFIDMEQRPKDPVSSQSRLPKLEGRVSRRRNGAISSASGGPWPSLSVLLPQLRSSPSTSSSDSSPEPDYSSEEPSTSQTRRNSPTSSRLQATSDLSIRSSKLPKDQRVTPSSSAPDREPVQRCIGSDVRMEPNAPPPTSAPPYIASGSSYMPQQHYEYVHPEGPGMYPVEQPYYVSNEYNTPYIHEVPGDSRYVVEQGQAPPMGYYQSVPSQIDQNHCNGYPPQPNSSNVYMAPGYAGPSSSGAVYISAVPPQGYPDARGYPDQVRMSYPPGNRNVSQILHASRSAEQVGSSPHMSNSPMELNGQRSSQDSSPPKTSQKSGGGTKKRPSTTSLPSIPTSDPAEPKKQFQCQDCKKCVSSARNLKRHENSCKAKKQSVSGPPEKAPSSAGSPAKAPSPSKPPSMPPQQPPAQSYPPTYPNPAPMTQGPMPFPHNANPHPQPPQGRYPPYPQSAVPQGNPAPMFEYPSTGMPGGLHSAPPVMPSYNPPLQAYPGPSPQHHLPQTPTFQQRPTPQSEYSDSPNNFGFAQNMEAYLDTTIDEVGHNPLAFIGAAEYDSGHSAEQSMSNTSDYPQHSQTQPKEELKDPKSDIAHRPVPQPPESGKAGKKSDKNTKPTDFQCNDCLKYMCSQRSLRRHRTTCKMIPENNHAAPPVSTAQPATQPLNPLVVKKEEKYDSPEPRCHCGAVFSDDEKLEQHKQTCVESKNAASTSQGASENAKFCSEKTLMPPPEAEQSKPIKEEVDNAAFSEHKSEEVKAPGTSSVTVGEHLRHIHGKPVQIPIQKKLQKKPMVIKKEDGDEPQHQQAYPQTHPHMMQAQQGQPIPQPMHPHAIHIQYQPVPQPHDIHMQNPHHQIPAQPIANGPQEENKDEANRKSEQVADVVNSVVEKIRRQNESCESQPLKRAAPPQHSPVQNKMMRQEGPEMILQRPKVPPMNQMHPHMMNIPPRPQLIMPARPMMMAQSYSVSENTPTSAPPNYMHPPQQTPTSAPPNPAPAPPKDAVRYLCPECCKTYSCRKHMKNHRQKEHSLNDEQVEGQNAAKRVKVNPEGFIITPGFEHENEIIKQRMLTNPPKVSKKKSSAAAAHPSRPNEEQHRVGVPMHQPHSVPAVQGPSAFYDHNSYNPLSAMEPLSQSSESSTPQYEQLQPVPMDYTLAGVPTETYHQRMFNHADDLDVWDQIKARVDGPFNHTRADELDVARIAADLKRSAEESQLGELHSTSYQMTHYTDQMVVESRKPVELAEADSTFCEDMDDPADRLASSTMISKHMNPISSYMTDIELSHQLHALEAPKTMAKAEKKHKSGNQGKSDRKRPCPTCGRLLSTDYSLKRHSTKCKQNQQQGAANNIDTHLENSNDSAPPEPSTDDSHSADPDSTTLNPPNGQSQPASEDTRKGPDPQTAPLNAPAPIVLEHQAAEIQ
ncbi:unnamed protein product [Bursaphelenchus okinawaensis]|uniref:C2H2-type domain-containing protein n=1 Tax=Bursaphelenchus okinawaensis TaxID=465554 RepID=A0A811K620_9BILA|nr:unnamed protein product [Bursaphelenchus okinawaensis]CAG9093550.1 unnamed protein product [Bursaphelenchus okinawaensis]